MANASHELRTPLTVINGFLEIALTSLDLPDGVPMHHLESIHFPLHNEFVAMSIFLERIYQKAVGLSAAKQVSTLEINGPNLESNREGLYSAFSPFVTNAIRYTPEGGYI